jgi:steroid 5-alpha reductase family enzyme
VTAPPWWPETLPFELLPFLAVALLLSAGGFKRVVYFVSLGYAFSVAAIAALSVALFRESATPLAVVHCLGITLYGVRLGSFLIRREFRPSYRKELAEIAERGAGINLPIQLSIWITVALLYVVMPTPAIYAMVEPAPTGGMLAVQIAGLALLFGGLLLESIADRQKSAYKAEHPSRFCDVKLYRMVRCPNYFGEMVVWLGVFVAGIHAYDHWLRWLTAAIGFVCIQLIMVGSAKRLEKIQGERYGDREDYRAYAATVPVLFPGLPIYSLQRWKIVLG